ncbi:cell division topological specificity factor MinE [bacterium]|nr:cell division topological specificity factor MinE [bacterium]
MFENIINFFKNLGKKEDKKQTQAESSKDAAKERLHLVLMQDRANVSADFLELMKQEIIDVIKKYIEVDEKEIDVRLTNKENEDGTNGAPALYANIPILNIKNDARKIDRKDIENKNKSKENQEDKQENVENKEEKEDIDNNIIIENDEKEKNNEQVEENSETKENEQEETEQKEEVKSEN